MLLAAAGWAPLTAQAVDRTDTPKHGVLRVTFDPRILAWSQQFTTAGLEPLGASLSGDTIGALHIPVVARLQQDVRTASGVSGFVASLGKGLLSARLEKRVTPVTAEIGLTDRLSFAVTVPIVRTAARSAFKLSTNGANLGANPLATLPGADQDYALFFTQFDAALANLSDSIGTGHYGCPSGPQCGQAQLVLARAQAIRDALHRTVYGVGATGSAFVPLDKSDAGVGIDSTVVQLQRDIQTTYHVPGFNQGFLLAVDSLTGDVFDSFLNDSSFGFGYDSLRNTWRYGLGDIAFQAKYRFVSGRHYAAALAAIARLATGARDSALELVDVPIADHQPAFEGSLVQELTLAGRLWLNLSVRGGVPLGTTRARRVAPDYAFLVPLQAMTVLNWTAGRYLAVDIAPLYRFAPRLAAGLTAGYWTKHADRYRYQSAQDSIDVATRLGAPIAAGVLEKGTSERWLRLGVALTYTAPGVEGSFTVERTVSGVGGWVPAATVFRLVLRASRKLF
jgi:hypothetical protein